MSPRILLSVLVVTLTAVLVWLMLDRGPEIAPGPVVDGSGVQVEEPADLPVASAVDTVAARAGDGVRREEIAGKSGQANADLHPSVAAALSGYRGRIVTPEAAPIEGAKVELFRFAADSVIAPGSSPFLGDEPTFSIPEIDAGDAMTDATGTFEITGLWPRGFFLLRAGIDTDAPASRVVDTTPNPGEIIDLGDIVVAPSGILTGIVTDDDDEPLAGALVRAIDLPGELLSFAPVEHFDPEGGLIAKVGRDISMVLEAPSWVKQRYEQLPIPTARTDRDGRFRLTGVVPGNNTIIVRGGKLQPLVRSGIRANAGEERDVGTLALREGEWISGRVTDETGEPVANAEVFGGPTGSTPVAMARSLGRTDVDGKFEASGFPNGDVIVAARRTPGDAWVISDKQPILRDVEITLSGAANVTLRLASAMPDTVIDAAEFQLTPGDIDRGSVEMAMWGVSKPLNVRDRVRHDEDDPALWHIDGIPLGRYALLARVEGHAIGAVQVDLEEGNAEVELTLQPTTSFDVRVTDAAGAPIAGAAVYVESRGQRPRVPEMPLHAGTTDEEGALVVDEVYANKVRLTAYHPAYGNAHAESDLPAPAPIGLQMEVPGAVTGMMTEKGAVPALGKWTLTIERRWSSDDRGAMPDMPRMVVPDADGRFAVKGLRPGGYRIKAIDSISAIQSPGQMAGMFIGMGRMSNGNRTPRQEFEIVAGVTTELRYESEPEPKDLGPTARLTGSVLLDGQVSEDLTVNVSNDAENFRHSVEVDESGRFDLGEVPDGNVEVDVYLQSKAQGGGLVSFRRPETLDHRAFELAAGADQDLAIVIQTGSVTGFVRDPSGAPAENCRVWLSKSGNRGFRVSRSVRTDTSGRFEAKQLPIGTYTANATSDQAKGQSEPVEISPGLIQNLDIQLVRSVWVRGNVDMAAFGTEKPDWIWMNFIRAKDPGNPESGSEREWAQVDKVSGKFETRDLRQGRWTVELSCHAGDEHKQYVHDGEIIVGTQDLDNLVIQPRLKQ